MRKINLKTTFIRGQNKHICIYLFFFPKKLEYQTLPRKTQVFCLAKFIRASVLMPKFSLGSKEIDRNLKLTLEISFKFFNKFSTIAKVRL